MDELISRQAAIDALTEHAQWMQERYHETCSLPGMIRVIEGLPSAQEPCEDAVSRQALKKGFNEMCDLACPYTKKQRHVMCGSCGLGTAFDVLEATPSVTPKQQWIPCSERLPDREMPVWVSMCDDDVLKAIWRNGWCEPNGYKVGLTDGQVIAWMPRQTEPQPYQEEGDQ